MEVGTLTAMSARDKAYQVLRKQIIYFERKPGDPLNDKEVALQLDMSRTPVREALISLQHVNLVEVRPRSGTYVSRIDCSTVQSEQYIRWCIEKEIFREACTRLDAGHRLQLERNLESYAHIDREHEPIKRKQLLELDNEFHGILFDAAGQSKSYEHVLSQLQHVERVRMLSYLLIPDQEILQDHRELTEAVLNGNEEKVERLLKHHLERYRDDILVMSRRYPEFFSNLEVLGMN